MPDPTTYDYSAPRRNCDIVMKGGITSGVVYPFAVCELAQTYRFKSHPAPRPGARSGATRLGVLRSYQGSVARQRVSGVFKTRGLVTRWVAHAQVEALSLQVT